MRRLLTHSFLLFTVCAIAQQQYTITHYIQEQGLPSGTIRALYKDTNGYLWFTSEGSHARFDGYTYKTYRYHPDIRTVLPGSDYWEAAFSKCGDICKADTERFTLPRARPMDYKK